MTTLYIYYSFFKYGTSPSFEHIKIFKNIDDKSTFVDVGANRGQFSLLIHYLYPKNKIIAALKSEFSILKNIFKNTKNIKIQFWIDVKQKTIKYTILGRFIIIIKTR